MPKKTSKLSWLRVPEWVKWLLCNKELRELERYRRACGLAWQWNSQIPDSSYTARWIYEVGAGKRGMDIERFREHLQRGTEPDFRS